MSKSSSASQTISETSEHQEMKEFRGEYVGMKLDDGTRDGFGREVFANGDQYEGEYRLGLRNGRGCYTFTSGARYAGEWRKGCKDGVGKFNYADGSEYYGGWRHNKRHGFGKFTYANGDVYEGQWRENCKHGLGSYKYRELGVSCLGTWINGNLKGPTVVSYPGFEYHGHFEGTKPVGEGAFTFKNQHMLLGHNENPKKISESRPKCLSRFVAHEILPFDASRLPQHPIPLAEDDSASSICTVASSSCEELHRYQLHSPTLMSADPVGDTDDEAERTSGKMTLSASDGIMSGSSSIRDHK